MRDPSQNHHSSNGNDAQGPSQPGNQPAWLPDVVFLEEGVLLPTLAMRAHALETGALVDVSDVAREAGFRLPVAVTRALWKDLHAIPAAYSHEDATGRLWDVLSVARYAIAQSRTDGSELLFQMALHVEDRSAYTVKLTVGPGDVGEPVMTLSSPMRSDKDVPLGTIHLTEGALDAFAEAQVSPAPFLIRHKQGDWGTLDDHDWRANDRALEERGRLVSAYVIEKTGVKIWIITEWDRSVTTVLLPNEY